MKRVFSHRTITLGVYAAGAVLLTGGVCLLAGGRGVAEGKAASVRNTRHEPAAPPPAEPYQWRNVEIVGGGFVTGILFSPKQPNLIYARTDIGGAYRWEPSVKRWTPLTDWVSQKEANLLGIESLLPDPTDANRLYAAVGTYTQSWAGNGAILRSTDQGRTWQRTDMPFKMGGNEDGRSIGERLAVDPNRNNVLYFGSRHDGLWKSTDHAATWSKVESFPVKGRTNGVGIGFVVFDPRKAADSTVYVGVAGTGMSLFRSADGGKTWETLPGQPSAFLPHHGVITPDGTLYVTYGNAPGPNGVTTGGVWKYETRIGAWADITPIVPGTQGMGTFGYAGLTVDAQNPDTLMVSSLDKWSSGDDIFRSTDGGKTWTSLKAKSERDSSAAPFLNWGKPHAELGHWIGDVKIDPFNSNHMLYVTGATIWGSDDVTALDRGQTTHWTVRAQGLEETAVLDLVSPPTGAHLLSALGDIGGFYHEDLTVSPRDGMAKNPILTTTHSLDYAGKAPQVVARVGSAGRGIVPGAFSTDGGRTWTPFATQPANTNGSGQIAVSADGSDFVWVPGSGTAHISRDRGKTWTACAGIGQRVVVAADRVNPAKFYALDRRAGKFAVSTDGGANFTTVGDLPAGAAKIRLTPEQEGDVWITAAEGGLSHSTDGGQHFTKLAGVPEAHALGFGKAAPNRTYPALYLAGTVGNTAGAFRSDDRGATWVRINDDQHQYGWIGQVITGDPRLYGRVYLGTNGRGILYADPVSAK